MRRRKVVVVAILAPCVAASTCGLYLFLNIPSPQWEPPVLARMALSEEGILAKHNQVYRLYETSYSITNVDHQLTGYLATLGYIRVENPRWKDSPGLTDLRCIFQSLDGNSVELWNGKVERPYEVGNVVRMQNRLLTIVYRENCRNDLWLEVRRWIPTRYPMWK